MGCDKNEILEFRRVDEQHVLADIILAGQGRSTPGTEQLQIVSAVDAEHGDAQKGVKPRLTGLTFTDLADPGVG